MDKGEINIIADTKEFLLKQVEIVFHKPNEFHAMRANGAIAPNVIVISFHTDSKEISYFNDKYFPFAEKHKMYRQTKSNRSNSPLLLFVILYYKNRRFPTVD